MYIQIKKESGAKQQGCNSEEEKKKERFSAFLFFECPCAYPARFLSSSSATFTSRLKSSQREFEIRKHCVSVESAVADKVEGSMLQSTRTSTQRYISAVNLYTRSATTRLPSMSASLCTAPMKSFISSVVKTSPMVVRK